MKPGPYQYCDECETERNHNWLETPNQNTYRCSACGKETKVKDRPPIPREAIFPGMGKIKLTSGSEMDHIDKEVLDEIEQNKPQLIAEVKKPAKVEDTWLTTFEPDLPKMGHEIKATPLEQLRGKRAPGPIFEESGPFPKIEPDQVGSMVAGQSPLNTIGGNEYIGSIDPTDKNIEEGNFIITKRPIPTGVGIEVQVPVEDRIRINQQAKKVLEEKPKPSAGGWADAL